MTKKPIYLDYHSTTPLDPRVFDAMKPFFLDKFGNPGSRTHEYGSEAEVAVEDARKDIARLIKADSPKEIIFVSGATEANNIALQGIAKRLAMQDKRHIISSAIEHKSVLDVLTYLKDKEGFEITFLEPDLEGRLDLEKIKNAITEYTGLISIMFANNEIGTINPVAEIGALAAQHNLVFHCDGAQAFGKVPIDVQKMGIHLLSISAHKIYGPKGIGALYIRRQRPRISLDPIIFGGGQERGLRSGTLPPALIIGLTEAAKLAAREMQKEDKRLKTLRDNLLDGLKRQCGEILINGALTNRLSNNLNVSFPGVDSEALMMKLRSNSPFRMAPRVPARIGKADYVLRAMGFDEDRAKSAIRFGLGHSQKQKKSI